VGESEQLAAAAGERFTPWRKVLFYVSVGMSCGFGIFLVWVGWLAFGAG